LGQPACHAVGTDPRSRCSDIPKQHKHDLLVPAGVYFLLLTTNKTDHQVA